MCEDNCSYVICDPGKCNTYSTSKPTSALEPEQKPGPNPRCVKPTRACRKCVNFCESPYPIYNSSSCRAHPPTTKGWPLVYPDDWCGEFTLDKSKLFNPKN